jgi:hypothetical protein
MNKKIILSSPAPFSITFPCYVNTYQDSGATGYGERNKNYAISDRQGISLFRPKIKINRV